MDFRSEYYGRRLVANGFWAYYAYETPRDMLLRRMPRVINILTNADLLQISKLFPDIIFRENGDEPTCFIQSEYPVHFYVSDYPADRAVRIPGIIEINKNACKHAAAASLFTINSFFYDFERDIFYDPLDAYPVFKQSIIRTTMSPERAAENFPTITLKTAKILSETGFEIDRSLLDFLRNNRSLYNYNKINVSIARNFFDICVSGRAYEALKLLDECGIIDRLLPEVALLKSVDQDKDHHPEGNGFQHTLECMKCVKRPNKTLMISILLHDTGKALTQADRSNNKPFPNHSTASKIIARNVLRRFYFNEEEIEEVSFLVHNHMILNAVDRLPERRLRTLFTSPYFPNLLELYRADLKSSYHSVENYYHAARVYREFKRKDKMRRQGFLKQGFYT